MRSPTVVLLFDKGHYKGTMWSGGGKKKSAPFLTNHLSWLIHLEPWHL